MTIHFRTCACSVNTEMDALQLLSIVRKNEALSQVFAGIFDSNRLRISNSEQPFSCIVNYAYKKGGSHWVALHFNGTTLFYFDSFGGRPNRAAVKRFCKQFSRVVYSKVVLQADRENNCGLFVMYVLDSLVKGEEFEQIISHLAQHPNANQFVRNYARSVYNVETFKK